MNPFLGQKEGVHHLWAKAGFPPDGRGMCMDIGLHDLVMDFPLDLTNGRVIV